MKALLKQLTKYISTAAICGGIDYGLLILLVEVFKVHYLVAALIALLTAMIVQYFFNVRFVFDTRSKSGLRKLFGYIILGLIGLGLNQLIIFVAVDKVKLHYIAGKVCASALVGIYNFVSRKIYLERVA